MLTPHPVSDTINTAPAAGQIYQHYKGKLYKIITLARHTETEEWCVVYQSLYGTYDYWIRPLSMFCESIEIKGVITPRFKLIASELPHASMLQER